MRIFLSCFVISLFFCFNSYLCGKLIKKVNYKINDSISFVLGSFVFFAIIQLSVIPVLLLEILNYSFFGYYLIGIQLILIIIYLFNWRFSLSIQKFDFIRWIYILIGIVITFVILFAFKNYKYSEIINSEINWNTNLFNINEIASIDKSLLDKFSNVILLLLKVNNINLAKQYLWMFPYSIIISNTLYGIFCNVKNKKIKNFLNHENKYWLISYLGSIILLNILSLWIYTSPSDGNAWITFTILLILYLHKESLNHAKNVNYGLLLSLISIGLFFLSPNSVFCIVIINVYFMYINHKLKINNLFDFNLLMFFGILLSISLYLNDYVNYIGYIIGCLIIGGYLIYFFFRSTRIFRKEWISHKDHKNIYYDLWLYICIICIFILLTIITFVQNNKTINWQYWIINNVLNKEISNTQRIEIYYLVNIVWWIANILVFALSIIDQIWRKDSTVNKIQIINNVTTWNPITTQFWYRILPNNVSLITNNSMIGSSYLMIWISKYLYNVNNKKEKIISWSILISSTTIFVCMMFINVLG